ncbi:hypothetical protein ACIBJE_17170 [Micromonospora sp. NPDC050187]|uniref:hypothetical protein n=1 Tax=Micromonospora sp. NPDC050187 TaxID=3364277 RepID=UPI00378BA050
MNVKQPWYYYAILQHLAVCLAAVALIVGVLLTLPEPSEPKAIHWRPAMADERRAYEVKQLFDLMEAQRLQG